MKSIYTQEEAIESVKHTYVTLYISLQIASMAFLTYIDNSPLVLSYAVALMSTRYIMAKLTSKHEQDASIGFHRNFMTMVALTNFAVTGMLVVATKFMLSIPHIIGVFVFLTVFSNIAVFLEKWYEFMRRKRNAR